MLDDRQEHTTVHSRAAAPACPLTHSQPPASDSLIPGFSFTIIPLFFSVAMTTVEGGIYKGDTTSATEAQHLCSPKYPESKKKAAASESGNCFCLSTSPSANQDTWGPS